MSQSYVPLAKLRHTERKPVTWRVPELSDGPSEKQIVGTSSYRSGMGKSGPSEVRRKDIGDTTYRNIWVRAAGRCVLCSTYLLDARFHYHSAKAVGEVAHNVGATDTAGSPRGKSALTLEQRAAEDNLLLLCHSCHKAIDDPANVEMFTQEWLLARKLEHELRVHRVTNFATLQKTLVLANRGMLRGAPISVTDRQITEALVDAGLVAHVRDGWRTDVVIELDDEPSAPYAWERGCHLIDRGIEKLETGIKQGGIDHVSVFALTYIPWLVYLGSRLDDTLTVKVFDHDRKGRDRAWCWKQPTRSPVSFGSIIATPEPEDAEEVVVVLNVSGTVKTSRIPKNLTNLPVIKLRPDEETPKPGIIETEVDLDAAAEAWIGLLAKVEEKWPNARILHVIGPIPASLAVRVGMHRMRSAQAELIVYHLDGDTYHPAPAITDTNNLQDCGVSCN
ncbi:SAVED domain-containing protein [Nocardiopsis sp. ATB16-24]|uniref:SAVED domain-containing protein n=1 Tax=Nocardiopsis sp. ATB16-24 TaxID=3019555 RepID=UPI002553018A|nr:SAVED domain-containing protein [Nocardiopsis sp. ATB16-24]